MQKRKRNFVLGLIAFFCGLIVVVMSAAGMAGVQSKAQLIGLIAGSFGAGAALANAVRDYKSERSRER